MRKENVVSNKGLSSRKVWRPAGFRDLPSAKSLLNKEQQPYFIEQAEGPGLYPALYPALQPCGTGSAGTTIFLITAVLHPRSSSRYSPYGRMRDIARVDIPPRYIPDYKFPG